MQCCYYFDAMCCYYFETMFFPILKLCCYYFDAKLLFDAMLLYDVMFCLLGDLIVGHLELGEEDGAVLGSPAVNDRDDLDPPAHCPQVPQVLYRPLHRLGHNNPHIIRDRAKKNIQSA